MQLFGGKRSAAAVLHARERLRRSDLSGALTLPSTGGALGLAEAARNGAARCGHLDDLGLQCNLRLIPLCVSTLEATAVPPPAPATVPDVDVHALDLDAALNGLPTNHDADALPLP